MERKGKKILRGRCFLIRYYITCATRSGMVAPEQIWNLYYELLVLDVRPGSTLLLNITVITYFTLRDTLTSTKQFGREKQLKNWHRQWKANLIKQQNPDMRDLAADWD